NQVVVGGMQDNSTAWTNSDDPNFTWTIPSSGDGSFAAVSNGSQFYYFSSQNGVVYKMELDNNGNRIGYRRIDPENGSSYLFINPFILDPNDQNTMYVSSFTNIFRHNHLDTIALLNKGGRLKTGWTSFIANSNNLRVTTLEASYFNPKHRL